MFWDGGGVGNKAEIECAVRATHSHTRETMGPLGGGPGSPPLREPLASGQMNHYHLTPSSPDPSTAVTGFPYYLNQSPRSAPRPCESSLSAAEWRECPSWHLPSTVHRRKRSIFPSPPSSQRGRERLGPTQSLGALATYR